jgi:hypothetical protein
MQQDHTDTPPPLAAFELTYSPGYKPSGAPLNAKASRHKLQERRTAVVQALTAEGATRHFEREHGLMVTKCARLQDAPRPLPAYDIEITELTALAASDVREIRSFLTRVGGRP